MDSFAALATLESRMTHLAGLERDQLLLLPEAVDDYVGSDNPVRFIDAFVDGLDLTAAGFLRVEAKAMGRPGYAPGDETATAPPRAETVARANTRFCICFSNCLVKGRSPSCKIQTSGD